MSWLLFISALPQCGDYLRAATIRGAPFIRGNTVFIIICYFVSSSIYLSHRSKSSV